MTLTVLASFSFLALVVTARPILDSRQDSSLITSKSAQDAIHAFFQSRTGLSPPPNEDIQVHLTSPAEQQGVLAQLEQLGIDAVKVIAPVQDGEERELYEAIGGKLDDLDGGVGELDVQSEGSLQVAESEASVNGSPIVVSENLPTRKASHLFDIPVPLSEPPALLLITLSVITAVAMLLGVTVALCFVVPFRKSVFGKGIRLEDDHEKGFHDGEGDAKEVDLEEMLSEKMAILDKKTDAAEEVPKDEEKPGLINFHEPAIETSSPRPATPVVPDLPPPSIELPSTPSKPESTPELHPDPELLPLPSPTSSPSVRLSPLPTLRDLQTPPRSPARKPLQMREIPQASGQPTWATLASATASTSDLSIPGALPLSMFESSPSTGLGGSQHVRRLAMPVMVSDPAWMVRLLVQVMWGWMAVFVGGGGR